MARMLTIRRAARERKAFIYFALVLSPVIVAVAVPLYGLIGASLALKLGFTAILMFVKWLMAAVLAALEGLMHAIKAHARWKRLKRR